MKQKGIMEYTNHNSKITTKNSLKRVKEKKGGGKDTEPINFIKGFCNIALNIVDCNEVKNKDKIIDEILKLKRMSLREDMNRYINLQTRRNQVQKLLLLLELIKDDFKESTYKEFKKILKNISLENFARQILPYKSGIVKKSQHKTENYLNKNDMLNKSVLEPREYIGINPLSYSDLDAPSIVTALTPGKYRQPEHSHENNYEITFYTGKSIAQYRDKGELITLKPDFGDFVIFPPNTIHTIYNPSEKELMNISIKLPSALLDRGETIDNRDGKGEIRKTIKTKDKGIYKSDLEKEKVPYNIEIYNFSEIKEGKHILDSKGKISCFYIIKGNFIGNFKNIEKKYSLAQGDTIYLEKNKEFDIKDLNNDGVIYGVFLESGTMQKLCK